MLRLPTTAMAALLLATPAMAWTNTVNGSGQIVDGGPGAQANAHAKATAQQHQTQIQHQGQSQQATGGSVNLYSGNNGGLAGGGGGGNSGNGGRAPDVVMPSIGGGGMDCPTVGFGAAGSGLGGGGGIGPSWISSDCNHRKVALLLSGLYGAAVARAYAEKNIEGVSEAVALASQGSHADPVSRPKVKPEWCRTSSGIELTNHKECR